MPSLKNYLPFIAAMTLVVVASNILVQYPFDHFGMKEILTWGAFTYPIAFLVNDLTNRTYGKSAARRVVIAGFVIAVILSFYLATPRIAIASGTAFLTGQLLDIQVFDRLRRQSWWKAPFMATVLAPCSTPLFSSQWPSLRSLRLLIRCLAWMMAHWRSPFRFSAGRLSFGWR
jgi:queuosine precursor transporter